MPKVKWAIDKAEPEELEGFQVYDGPDLVRGVYNGVLTRLTIKTNSNGDDMLNGLFIVKDDRPDKKKFNGADVWFNQNITEQGKPYVLQFLKAMGLTWSDFINKTVTESDDRPTKVTRISRTKFNDGAEVPVRVQIGMSRATPDYPSKPEIKQFLKPVEDEDWADDSDDDDGDEEDPFA